MAKLFQRSLKAQKSDPVAPTEAQRTAAVTQTADSDHQQKVERIRQEMAEKRRSMEDALHKEFEDKKAKIHAGWQSRLNEEKFRADKEIKEAKDRADKEKAEQAERDAREKAEKEKAEKEERDAREKADKEKAEQAERDAREKAQKEKAEQEQREKAEQEQKEKAEQEERDAREKALRETAEQEERIRAELEQELQQSMKAQREQLEATLQDLPEATPSEGLNFSSSVAPATESEEMDVQEPFEPPEAPEFKAEEVTIPP